MNYGFIVQMCSHFISIDKNWSLKTENQKNYQKQKVQLTLFQGESFRELTVDCPTTRVSNNS